MTFVTARLILVALIWAVTGLLLGLLRWYVFEGKQWIVLGYMSQDEYFANPCSIDEEPDVIYEREVFRHFLFINVISGPIGVALYLANLPKVEK